MGPGPFRNEILRAIFRFAAGNGTKIPTPVELFMTIGLIFGGKPALNWPIP